MANTYAVPKSRKSNETDAQDIAAKTRKTVIAALTPVLSDALDLRMQVKQAHWMVRGENFLRLHEFFDALHTAVDEYGDEVAERILQLNGTVNGTVKNTASNTRLSSYNATQRTAPEHIDGILNALTSFLAPARTAIDTVDDAGDAISADILTSIVRGLDKWRWLLESHRA